MSSFRPTAPIPKGKEVLVQETTLDEMSLEPLTVSLKTLATLDLGNKVTMKLALLPAGKFLIARSPRPPTCARTQRSRK